MIPEAEPNGGPPPLRAREVHFGEPLTAMAHGWRSLMTSGPGILWVMVFLVIPLLAIIVISFMTRGETGGYQPPFTLENYKRFIGFGFLGFDFELYPRIVLRSLALGVGTAFLCVLSALPLAFFIAALPPRYKTAALVLVLIPFWTNLLIRTYAWQMLLGPDSWLTRPFVWLHLCPKGEPLYPSTFAVYVGMVCDYLPFIVLPLYASVEKIDWCIAEAASDLGADGPRVFWHAVLPQISPGLVAGVVLTLVPATGQFVIPDLLGGAKTAMVGNVIQQQFGPSRDWPFGSAVTCLTMGLVLLGLWVYARAAAEKGGEIL
jgi:spermidine/putrescine transport system permease protein